jgi:hypothetical protein
VIVWSILHLLFWTTVATFRLTLRFVIGLLAWGVGVSVGYKLVRGRSRE